MDNRIRTSTRGQQTQHATNTTDTGHQKTDDRLLTAGNRQQAADKRQRTTCASHQTANLSAQHPDDRQQKAGSRKQAAERSRKNIAGWKQAQGRQAPGQRWLTDKGGDPTPPPHPPWNLGAARRMTAVSDLRPSQSNCRAHWQLNEIASLVT